MAKNKFYAVRKGRRPGIYASWDECQAQVSGFSGAEFKSFASRPDAEAYLSGRAAQAAGAGLEYPYAFTDGSYAPKTGTVGYGGFLRLAPGAEDLEVTGSTKAPGWAEMRNVAGEVLGCMKAVELAKALGLRELHVYHDYTGVSCWPDGSWEARKPETRLYREFIAGARAGGLAVVFHKVAGHTGIPGNEKADALAKQAAGIGA